MSENQYDPQQTTKICVTFLRVIGFLCKYCSIIVLSFVCYTCMMCANSKVCTHCLLKCQIWALIEIYWLHGTACVFCFALFIPFALLLLLLVRSMQNQGQGRRQSHLTSVTPFTFITISWDRCQWFLALQVITDCAKGMIAFNSRSACVN